VTERSIGIAGSTDHETIRRLAPIVERAGYRALWINDTPGGDALSALAVAADVTSTLGLAAGVIPLDRESGAAIARRVVELGMPQRRLRLGIGSGGARHGLALVEAGIAELRALDVPVLVGALGPRTRSLAARKADGILFNWLDPASAAEAMTRLRADAAGRAVEGVLYARTIASPRAREALDAECARYAAIPQYAANFARLGIRPGETTIDLGAAGSVERFDVVDELVLRAMTPTGSDAELAQLVEAGAPDGVTSGGAARSS
jgi:alkanesulfonate monooxygenase SsuD/methylene tetrahydromethanopterin reductase-like flavin-dependent oxidoreductase (luciferase family)